MRGMQREHDRGTQLQDLEEGDRDGQIEMENERGNERE